MAAALVQPRPVADFENTSLREQVQKAIEGIEPGHGHAVFYVENKGAGVMLVERFNDVWALTVGARYDLDSRDGGVRVALQASW